MNIGALIAAIAGLLALFLFGRKCGSDSQKKKNEEEKHAMVEEIKAAEVRTESAEKQADLAVKVADVVAETEQKRTSYAMPSISELQAAADEHSLLDLARRQAEVAEALKNR